MLHFGVVTLYGVCMPHVLFTLVTTDDCCSNGGNMQQRNVKIFEKVQKKHLTQVVLTPWRHT